ncbi:MAG: hypothetical protein QG670_18 [Thermoproteota archaeon]|nr:hypothetical protein [Thermoproteota archaeon]
MEKIITQERMKRSGSSKLPAGSNYQKSLAEQILVEARRMARLELVRMAEQVLTEATSIARWEKRPFYIA